MKYVMAGAAAVLIATQLLAAPEYRTTDASIDLTRVCIPVSGNSSTLSLSGTSDVTAALDPATVYEIVCDVPVYWGVGDDSDCTATSSNQLLPANVPRYFGTSVNGAISDRVCALDVATDGSCWIRACR